MALIDLRTPGLTGDGLHGGRRDAVLPRDGAHARSVRLGKRRSDLLAQRGIEPRSAHVLAVRASARHTRLYPLGDNGVSNSANAPTIWNMSRPEGVEVSSPCFSRYRSTRFARMSSSSASRSRSDRPRRHTLQLMSTSNRRRAMSRWSASKPRAAITPPGAADPVVAVDLHDLVAH